MNTQHRQGQTQAVDISLIYHDRRVDHQSSLETGTAHVHYQALVPFVRLRIDHTRTGPGCRAGQQSQSRFFPCQIRRHDTTVGLHDQQYATEPSALEATLQLIEIMVKNWPDIGIQRRGTDALIEADRRQQIR